MEQFARHWRLVKDQTRNFESWQTKEGCHVVTPDDFWEVSRLWSKKGKPWWSPCIKETEPGAWRSQSGLSLQVGLPERRELHRENPEICRRSPSSLGLSTGQRTWVRKTTERIRGNLELTVPRTTSVLTSQSGKLHSWCSTDYSTQESLCLGDGES